MDGTELPKLPELKLQDGVNKEEVDAKQITNQWLSELEHCLAQRSFERLADIFVDDCWWRDIVGLTWGFSCKRGHSAIRDYLVLASHGISELRANTTGGLQPMLVEFGCQAWIQSGFTFRTPYGEGKGLLRLMNVSVGEWKAWTVFTQLEQFDYMRELESERARFVPSCREPLLHHASQSTQVLIVGAGQSYPVVFFCLLT